MFGPFDILLLSGEVSFIAPLSDFDFPLLLATAEAAARFLLSVGKYPSLLFGAKQIERDIFKDAYG